MAFLLADIAVSVPGKLCKNKMCLENPDTPGTEELEDELNQMAELREDVDSINNNETFKSESCVICMERIPNVLFCSCGHICICRQCNKKQVLKKCPLCKTNNKIKRII